MRHRTTTRAETVDGYDAIQELWEYAKAIEWVKLSMKPLAPPCADFILIIEESDENVLVEFKLGQCKVLDEHQVVIEYKSKSKSGKDLNPYRFEAQWQFIIYRFVDKSKGWLCFGQHQIPKHWRHVPDGSHARQHRKLDFAMIDECWYSNEGDIAILSMLQTIESNYK